MSEMGMNSKSGGNNGSSSYNTQNISKSETKNNNDPKIQMIGQNIMNTPHVGIPSENSTSKRTTIIMKSNTAKK